MRNAAKKVLTLPCLCLKSQTGDVQINRGSADPENYPVILGGCQIGMNISAGILDRYGALGLGFLNRNSWTIGHACANGGTAVVQQLHVQNGVQGSEPQCSVSFPCCGFSALLAADRALLPSSRKYDPWLLHGVQPSSMIRIARIDVKIIRTERIYGKLSKHGTVFLVNQAAVFSYYCHISRILIAKRPDATVWMAVVGHEELPRQDPGGVSSLCFASNYHRICSAN